MKSVISLGKKHVVFSKDACEKYGIIDGLRLSNSRRSKRLTVYENFRTGKMYCNYQGQCVVVFKVTRSTFRTKEQP